MEAHGRGTGKAPRRLAVCGSQLVSGSRAFGGQREVMVWGLETLDLQHTLLARKGRRPGSLGSGGRAMGWRGERCVGVGCGA